jgi:aromatic ring-opening dioxygenase catalytic subunit (LigB family)
MAQVIGGFGVSHSPSMGYEYDKGIAGKFDPRWKIWFDGLQPVKRWLADARPDQIVIVYNDHLNHFTFEAYPTFALGVADVFPQADEGFGLRPFPSLKGDTQFGWHVANYLVRHEFDLTICEDMKIDHGIYSWLPYVATPPWPAPVLPLAVNMVRHPIPTSVRLRRLGEAIRAAIASYPGNARVAVIATGGMSHQISGARFGMANEEWDRYFLAHLKDDLDRLVAVPQEEMMRIGGTEASELALWFAMRGALSDVVHHVYDFYTFPQITGCGVIVFDEPRAQAA